MSSRTVAIACALSSFSFAARASGDAGFDGGAAAAPPAVPFAFLDAPPPPPAPEGPAPLGEADEHPRKSWELVPEVGLGVPFCRGASFGADRCADNGGGLVVGGSAFYRMTPYVALGPTLSLADFHVGGPIPASSGASFLGFAVRGYFTERGVLDPYVETGIGRGTAAIRRSEGGVEARTDGAGLAIMAAAGVDFWVAPYLKLGPSVAYRWTWLSDLRTCVGDACETASAVDRGAVGSYATLSFNATLSFGREM